jgi:large repetitive protein
MESTVANIGLTSKPQWFYGIQHVIITLVIWLWCAGYSPIAASIPATITNQATISYVPPNGTPLTIESGIVTAKVSSAPPAPKIELSKTATAPKPVSGQPNTYDITYTIQVKNTGDGIAPKFKLADNLNCTFRTHENPMPITAWQLLTKPQITGDLQLNSGYTGKSACPTTKTLDYDSSPVVQLVDGHTDLASGRSADITFTVRITLATNLQRTERQFKNLAIGAYLNNQKQLVTASAANVVTPLDPSGVVYNSATREPVSGVIVKFFRDKNTNNTGINAVDCTASITKEQLFNPFGIRYIENTDGSVSMITSADGQYSFYLNAPDACRYHLAVTPPNANWLWPSINIKVTQGIAPAGFVQAQPTAPVDSQDSTYYLDFNFNTVNSDVWNNHIPIDPKSADGGGGILLSKESNKNVAELGDSIVYKLTLQNASGSTLDNVQVKDILPRGFSLISNSSRLDGVVLPEPAGPPGAELNYNLTGLNWANDTSIILTYQVRIGVGTAIDKSSVNIAQATSGVLVSNQASSSIIVTGGVFSDDAYIIGKVYLEDCNADKVQGDKELGVPGVRLFMEDGTNVVTDVEGKYSLYGLSPITHVLKVDNATLPKGAHLMVLSNRNSGKGDSRFVDLKKGELHKADFAINSCKADTVVQDVIQRRKALEVRSIQDGTAILSQRFNASYTEFNTIDPRTQPATGILTPTGPQALSGLNNVSKANDPFYQKGMSPDANSALGNINTPLATVSKANDSVFQTAVPSALTQPLVQQRLNNTFAQRPSIIALEDVIKNLDNSPGFIAVKEGDTLPNRVVNIRVKGLLGSIFSLSVNGNEQSLLRVGKKSKIVDKQLEAWEYVGISLQPGKNTLQLKILDSFGNARETRSLSLIAPGDAGHIEIDAPLTAIADSKTLVKVTVRLVDDHGIPVTVRTPLTLELDRGTWVNEDLNPNEPGVQAFIEGGLTEVTILPPSDPGDSIVRASTGGLEQQVKIAFLPELRPLIGAGIIEGVVNFNGAGKINVNAPNAYDAFERELRNISTSGTDVSGAGRAAFFFKGTIKGEYLLTTAYDSDKDTKQRLFRDIQPDKFYPIYGDSSIKGFDAQSTQRFYLRVDKQKSYLLYGDFTTSDNSVDRKLSQYSRSATGLKGHYENGKFIANGWVSHDNLSQVVIEIPANGTSGPYKISGLDTLYENSEKIDILVRDRNQPTVILETIPMNRFIDYSIDLVTKEIFFKTNVRGFDDNLNPRTIRVIYESVRGGKSFLKGGVDTRVKVTDNIELGASYARDDNPQQKTQVMGSTAIIKLGEKTTLIGEVARTDTGENKGVANNGGFFAQSNGNSGFLGAGISSQGNAGFGGQSNSSLGGGYINQNTADITGAGWAERLELLHEGADLKVKAQIVHADQNFNNPSAGFTNGRTEGTANLKYQLTKQTSLIGQGVYSKDSINGGMRFGALAGIEHIFNDWLKAEFGMRAVHQALANGQQLGSGLSPGSSLVGVSDDYLTVRGKLSAKLPWIQGADVYTEAEQDVLDINKHLFAVGGGYLVNDKTRLYARYEFISSLNSLYAFNSTQRNNQAVIGVESAYSKDGRLFSEYRLRDAINGREAQSAMGLRQTWTLFNGLRVGGGFEMTHAFAGQPGSDSTAITSLAEYTADPRYKLTGSLEARFANSGNSYLNTMGLSYKINKDWSLLARNGLSVQENKLDSSELWRTRQQIGVAWRQVDNNRWNALGRYEHRLEQQKGGRDPYREDSHIGSTHLNYQPRRDLIASGRYAVKWSEQERNNNISKGLTHLLYGRATWDFMPDWDISVQSGLLKDQQAIQFSEGIELGYQVINDLWASVGYNLQGFDGGALKGTDYTAQGFYIRARFKFDENLFN